MFFYSFQRTEADTLKIFVQLCVVLYFLSFDVYKIDGASALEARDQVFDKRRFSCARSRMGRKKDWLPFFSLRKRGGGGRETKSITVFRKKFLYLPITRQLPKLEDSREGSNVVLEGVELVSAAMVLAGRRRLGKIQFFLEGLPAFLTAACRVPE